MGGKRFKRLGLGSFFGGLVYERAVPDSHFLRQLERVINWPVFSMQLIRLYIGRAEEGRPPYDPVVVLKMLLLAYLYNLPERQAEAYVNDSLSAKCFLGLAVDEPAPDHSTLTAFKRRIVERGKEACLQALLEEIVKAAQGQGIQFGSLQIVDSTHTRANVNTEKDDRRQDKAGKPPRDGDARWGVKHRRRYRNEQGEVVEQVEYFYGYKAHTSMNAEAEIITSVVVTGGNETDGKQFSKLVSRDRNQDLPVDTYAGDKGYDDTENHYLLESEGLHSAIKLNRYRTEKKDANKEVWLALKETPEYQAGQAVRYKIERKYGEAKEYHGLRRCRYLGRFRHTIQLYLTTIALNLKRIVRLSTGVAFKGRATLAA
jgi:IS5 family transposase